MHDAQTHFGAAHYLLWVLLNAHSWPVCYRHYKLCITEPKVCNGLEQQNLCLSISRHILKLLRHILGLVMCVKGIVIDRHLVLAPVKHILEI
jgi:hypothetical protein